MDGRHPLAFLDALEPHERLDLLSRGVARQAEVGSFLLLAGDPPDRVHLVLTGVVKLVGRDREGTETIVGLAVSGDLVGEAAVLDGRPHSTDAIAAARAMVLTFDAGAFLEVIHRSPRALLEVTSALARRLRWSEEAWLERDTNEVPGRLAGRLLALAELLGRATGDAVELELPLNQRDLARLAGMCRESACKTLRRFRDAGIVDYRGRSLRILRRDTLERLRCGGRGAGPYRSEGGAARRRSRSRSGT